MTESKNIEIFYTNNNLSIDKVIANFINDNQVKWDFAYQEDYPHGHLIMTSAKLIPIDKLNDYVDELASLIKKQIKVVISSKDYFLNDGHLSDHHLIFHSSTFRKMEQHTTKIEIWCSEMDWEGAKELLLKFTPDLKLLSKCKEGEIYYSSTTSGIYINDRKIDNFKYCLLTYNLKIKNKTTNDLTVYYKIVDKMIKECNTVPFIKLLLDYWQKNENSVVGYYELAKEEVVINLLKYLIKQNKYVLCINGQQTDHDIYDEIKYRRKEPFFIPTKVYIDILNNKYPNMYQYTFDALEEDYHNNFNYDFIDLDKMTKKEKEIYLLKDKILPILDKRYAHVNILIAKRIQKKTSDSYVVGLCDYENNIIIILQKQLESAEAFLSTLVHEYAHFTSNQSDNTRAFEYVLSVYAGILAKYICEQNKKK